jgi:hypothetical protein
MNVPLFYLFVKGTTSRHAIKSEDLVAVQGGRLSAALPGNRLLQAACTALVRRPSGRAADGAISAISKTKEEEVTMETKSKRYVVVIARAPNSNWARVLFGTMVDKFGSDGLILEDARQALYYDSKSGGEVGLAVIGPRGESRITGTVSRIEVAGVGFVADCSAEAVEAWTKAPVWVK